MTAENFLFFIQNNLLTKYVVILYYKRVEPDRKTPKLGNRACACPSKELKEFQRAVLNMMQLHPQANVLAECVFQRMPLEGFLDAKKVLLPDSGRGYDSLLDSGNCEFILNKRSNFVKK